MTLTTFSSRAAAALVAAVAGFSSYQHIVKVATTAGEHRTVALVLPLAIDGLIVVGTMAMLEDQRAGRVPRWSARVALAFGIVATLAANVASAQPTWTARAVAAVPAISFLIAVEVLARRGRPGKDANLHVKADNLNMTVELLSRSGKPRAFTDVKAESAPATVTAVTVPDPAPALIEPASAEVEEMSDVTSLPGRPESDPRAAAREAYRASVAAGAPLSGAALARRFGKSARWGVDRVAEVRKVNGAIEDAEDRTEGAAA